MSVGLHIILMTFMVKKKKYFVVHLFQLIFLRCGLKQTSTLVRRLMTRPIVTSSASITTHLTQLCLWMKYVVTLFFVLLISQANFKLTCLQIIFGYCIIVWLAISYLVWCCSSKLIFLYIITSSLGIRDAAEVQGFNHQAGARGVQLHASELV